MAFENLKPAAAIWRNLGLTFLLSDQNVPDNLGVMAPWLPPDAKPPKLPPQRILKAQHLPSPAKPAAPPPVQMPERPVAAWKPPSRDLWPVEWQKIAANIKPAYIAWTYMKLGQDLSASSSSDPGKLERRKLIAKIISDFSLPEGSHTFVPAALPDENGQLRVQVDIFWTILKEMKKCRALVFLDHQSAREVLKLDKTPIAYKIVPIEQTHGIRVWIIKDMPDLIQDQTAFSSAMKKLKRDFGPFFRGHLSIKA